MNLLEFFRHKQINITSNEQVSVKFVSVINAAELYNNAAGDLLLIKKHISMEDAEILLSYHGSCSIFTEQPKTLDSFDSLKKLLNIFPVCYIDSVELNYLHYGNTLIAFCEALQKETTISFPNAVFINPVYRNDVETSMSIDAKALKAEPDKKSNDMTQSQNSVPAESESEQKGSKTTSEVILVRKALKELFDKTFSLIKVNFFGTNIENKIIGLSGFYKDNGIAEGRLKGSWTLFDKNTVGNVMEKGILEKAREKVFKQFSVSIPSYGRIIKIADTDKLKEQIYIILSEYQKYLKGDADCKSIYGVPINQGFSPSEAINESMEQLRTYLISAFPYDKFDFSSYYLRNVNDFIEQTRKSLVDFEKQTGVNINETSYTENQWENRDFINRLWEAVNYHRSFFPRDFLSLLDRYSKLF